MSPEVKATLAVLRNAAGSGRGTLTLADVERLERMAEALEALSTRLEREIAHGMLWLPDHACAECVPGGEIVQTGFRCGRHAASALLKEGMPAEPGSGHPQWHEERQRGERCEHLRRYEDDCRECGRTCQKPCGWLFADGTRCQRPGDGHRHAGPVWTP